MLAIKTQLAWTTNILYEPSTYAYHTSVPMHTYTCTSHWISNTNSIYNKYYIPPSCSNLYILDSTSSCGCFDLTDSNFTATSSVDEVSVPAHGNDLHTRLVNVSSMMIIKCPYSVKTLIGSHKQQTVVTHKTAN